MVILEYIFVIINKHFNVFTQKKKKNKYNHDD